MKNEKASCRRAKRNQGVQKSTNAISKRYWRGGEGDRQKIRHGQIANQPRSPTVREE